MTAIPINELVRSGFVLLGLAGSLVACTPHREPEEATPPPTTVALDCIALDADHELTLPSSSGGSRFLNGWRQSSRGVASGTTAASRNSLVAGSTPTISVDRPTGAPLTVELEIVGSTSAMSAAARGSGRELAIRWRDGRLLVELPAATTGRSIVELDLPEGTRISAGRIDRGVALIGSTRRQPDSWYLEAGAAIQCALPQGAQRLLFAAGSTSRSRLEVRTGDTLAGAATLTGPRRQAAVPLSGQGWRSKTVTLVASGPGPIDLDPPRATIEPMEPARPSLRPVDARPKLVLVYVMDALRADAVDALVERNPDSTWAELLASGVRFTTHRSVAPNTLPSTKALFTGKVWTERGGTALRADDGTTLAERFRDAGYRTALFSNNPYVSADFGVDRGFDVVRTAPRTATERPACLPYHDDAERLHGAVLRWLEEVASDQPLFLYLHVLHPHNPYAPAPELAAELGQDLDSTIDGCTQTLVDVRNGDLATTIDDRRRLRNLYAAGLQYADRELGTLLEALDERYPRDRQLVVATSDHGEELFDHDGVLHGFTLYEEMVRIPLVVRSGDGSPARTTDQPTSTLDLHRLLTRITGTDPDPSPEATDGGAPRSTSIHLAAASGHRGGIFSATAGDWKLIWAPRRGRGWGQGQGAGRDRTVEAAFHLASDPYERDNRIGQLVPEVEELRVRLRAWVEAHQRQTEPETDQEPDEEVRERLEALGYLEG